MGQFKYGADAPKKVKVIGHGGRVIEIEEQVAKGLNYSPAPAGASVGDIVPTAVPTAVPTEEKPADKQVAKPSEPAKKGA